MPNRTVPRPRPNENRRLRSRVRELEEALRAMRNGDLGAQASDPTDLFERERCEEEHLELEQEQLARASAENANAVAQMEIGRRKRIEESLLLAEMDRTQLLERERLARTEAEAANRLKDEFLATLSHELRTPLSAILTWSRVLRQPGLDPEILARAVDAIDRNARVQSSLVADLLDVSRIVTGNFQMSVGPVRLADVIDLAAEAMRPAARIKNISLEVMIEPSVGSVPGDPNRLRQVVWNLLSNAIRVAPVGGRVAVRVSSVGPGVEIAVEDDGAGIDPAFLPFVFDRFRQGDSSSTRKHSGLGLGLALVRHLVELHGGTVHAGNRRETKGAVFTVRLPRSIDPMPLAAPAPERHALMPLRSLEDVTLLLVDDDNDALEGLALVLRHYGASVFISSSAREALRIVSEELPHVLIADIGMPDEDGHALLQSVRALPAALGGTTPAIALTAHATPRDRREAQRSGFQLHVAKPATPAELTEAIASLVPMLILRRLPPGPHRPPEEVVWPRGARS